MPQEVLPEELQSFLLAVGPAAIHHGTLGRVGTVHVQDVKRHFPQCIWVAGTRLAHAERRVERHVMQRVRPRWRIRLRGNRRIVREAIFLQHSKLPVASNLKERGPAPADFLEGNPRSSVDAQTLSLDFPFPVPLGGGTPPGWRTAMRNAVATYLVAFQVELPNDRIVRVVVGVEVGCSDWAPI